MIPSNACRRSVLGALPAVARHPILYAVHIPRKQAAASVFVLVMHMMRRVIEQLPLLRRI